MSSDPIGITPTIIFPAMHRAVGYYGEHVFAVVAPSSMEAWAEVERQIAAQMEEDAASGGAEART